MRNDYMQVISGLVAAVLLTGCGQGDVTSNNESNNLRSMITLAAIDDPCALVSMSPVIDTAAAVNSIDATILRYQQAASRSTDKLPRLERLGWAYVEKARATRDTGFYKLAEQTALCIKSQAPDSAESLLLQGYVLHNLHRFREAEQLARRLVELRGLWFDFALLGDVLMERGALDEATTAYQAVVDQRPGPQAYARIAWLRWLKGDLDGALEMMAQAVRATSSRTPEAAAWVHVRLALMLMQANELPAADAVLDRALSLMPAYSPALHARGRILLAQDQTQDAIVLLQQAVQSDPLPEYRWTLYEALQAAGQVELAGEQQAALRRFGVTEDPRTYALFLATTGDEPETALKLVLPELEQRKDVFTLDAVAWAMSSAGLNVEALVYSQRALSEGTKDARLHFHGGVIAARTGDSERALELLNKAKTAQQMLMPSERRQLVKEFAALQPRIPTLVSEQPARRVNYYF